MPRHDYDLPGDWDALSDQEKCDWYTMERCRRQARQQQRADEEAMGALGLIDDIFSRWKDRADRIMEATSEKNYK